MHLLYMHVAPVVVDVCVCALKACSMVSVWPGITVSVQLRSHYAVVATGALCDCGRERNYLRRLDNILG